MYRHILVPLDGSRLSECVLAHVTALARDCSVERVSVVRVVEPMNPVVGDGYVFEPERIQAIDEAERKISEEYLSNVVRGLSRDGIHVEAHVLSGRVAETLTNFAEGTSVDLILMATHGRSGITRWMLGSVAERVMRSSCVPVLMVRAPGCVPGV
jgi:nucleotide-binding universal stress UspA family protein